MTIKQEMEDDKLDKDNIDNEEKVNPYQNIIIDEFDRDNIITSQMEQWSILSNLVNYVQYDRKTTNFYNLDVKVIDKKNHKKIYNILKVENSQVLKIDFGETLDTFKGEYLGMYDGVK